jgi:hypothetical protein
MVKLYSCGFVGVAVLHTLPCLALSYLIHPRELRDVTIILPCNQYKILDALLLGLVLEGGVCIPYDCFLGEWDVVLFRGVWCMPTGFGWLGYVTRTRDSINRGLV